MFTKRLTVCFMLLAAMTAMTNTGCFQAVGPSLGIFSIPLPVSPYFQKIQEDKFHIAERYARVPILGPATGGEVIALDPPSDDEVMRAFERADSVQGGVPFLYEHQRNNVQIIKEKIADYLSLIHI